MLAKILAVTGLLDFMGTYREPDVQWLKAWEPELQLNEHYALISTFS